MYFSSDSALHTNQAKATLKRFHTGSLKKGLIQGCFATPREKGIGWRQGSLAGENKIGKQIANGRSTRQRHLSSCAARECRSVYTCVYDESQSADRCLQ